MTHEILRKEEQNETNHGKTTWMDKFYQFLLTFKYSCTIRPPPNVGSERFAKRALFHFQTDATMNPKRGAICKWKQSIFSFYNATCETNFSIPRGLHIPSPLSPSPYFSSLRTHTNTYARMRIFVSCFLCRSTTAVELRYHWLHRKPLTYNIKAVVFIGAKNCHDIVQMIVRKKSFSPRYNDI